MGPSPPKTAIGLGVVLGLVNIFDILIHVFGPSGWEDRCWSCVVQLLIFPICTLLVPACECTSKHFKPFSPPPAPSARWPATPSSIGSLAWMARVCRAHRAVRSHNNQHDDLGLLRPHPSGFEAELPRPIISPKSPETDGANVAFE